MKERPILMSAPMVRAILAGTKTQTRRVAPIADLRISRVAGSDVITWHIRLSKPIKGVLSSYSGGKFSDSQARSIIASQFNPYGQLGDRLWVREAWRVGRKYDGIKPSDLPPRSMTVEYEAGGYACNSPWAGGEWRANDCAPREHPEWIGKLRPGMFMPRWASRITLEVTAVRVERLQDISHQDAIAEGVEQVEGAPLRDQRLTVPQHLYAHLWEQINGPGSWDANPWVWVVQFRRIDAVKEHA